jgi:hypothetical protein
MLLSKSMKILVNTVYSSPGKPKDDTVSLSSDNLYPQLVPFLRAMILGRYVWQLS